MTTDPEGPAADAEGPAEPDTPAGDAPDPDAPEAAPPAPDAPPADLAQRKAAKEDADPGLVDALTPDEPASEDAPSDALTALAEARGVATEYWSFFGDRVHVPAATLRAVLTAMHVDASDDAAAAASLDSYAAARWGRLLPPSLVVRQGGGEVVAHVADGHDVWLGVALEDGGWRDLPVPLQDAPTEHGAWRLHVPLPADLPLGWHTLHAWQKPHGADEVVEATAPLAVTPRRLDPPPTRADHGGRAWGLMAQLYSVRSPGSWGVGDFADLADIASIAGVRGADFVLVNPVHAAEVVGHLEPSPYLPASRRFVAPLYIRPEEVREAAYLPPPERSLIAKLHADVAAQNTDAERIDRDTSWARKKQALELLFTRPRTASRQTAFERFVERGGRPLADFALWCAIEEHFDGRRPEAASDITSPAVDDLRDRLADRVSFYSWLQWIADEQAAATQAAAHTSGMTIGVMHDLAVGVHRDGSDAWSLAPMYAPGITVGAPPDMYNQQGQDWNQPPWLPDALAEAGYTPLRDMIRNLLRHAGALRIDHIIGFFRLWWIPADLGPAGGTYVRYDHEAMIGVLALEAHRAGAVVIGEDLGNVEPWVREYLSARGVLGTSVLWFEYDEDGAPLPPERWRRSLLATVNTHDLPPTAGYLAGEHVDLRARLNLLTEPVEEARAEAAAERNRMLAILRERGLVGADPSEEDIIAALHVYLVASDSELIGVALVDAVGERRAQNQPGTDTEYPNWQVPLADAAGDAVLVADLDGDPRFDALTAAVDRALRR